MSKSNQLPQAFSLLELIVVVVIVALISAAVAVQWSGVHHKAVRSSAVARLESLDQHLRSFARTNRTGCQLSVEIGSSKIRKSYHERRGTNPSPESLGRGIRIARIESTVDISTAKQVLIPFWPDGSSASYGIELTGPGSSKQWLVFAGISGQLTQLETEGDFDALWQSIKSERL